MTDHEERISKIEAGYNNAIISDALFKAINENFKGGVYKEIEKRSGVSIINQAASVQIISEFIDLEPEKSWFKKIVDNGQDTFEFVIGKKDDGSDLTKGEINDAVRLMCKNVLVNNIYNYILNKRS